MCVYCIWKISLKYQSFVKNVLENVLSVRSCFPWELKLVFSAWAYPSIVFHKCLVKQQWKRNLLVKLILETFYLNQVQSLFCFVLFLRLWVHVNFCAFCIIVPFLRARGWIIHFLGFSVRTLVHQYSSKVIGLEETIVKGGETNQLRVFPEDYNHIELLETFNLGATSMLCLKLFWCNMDKSWKMKRIFDCSGKISGLYMP